MVEVRNFLTQNEVFEQRRTAKASLERILVIADSNETAVKKISQFLLDHDYLIDTSNTNPMLVKTRFNYSKIRGNRWGTKLEATVKSTELKFKIIAVSQTGSETEDVPQVLPFKTNEMGMSRAIWDQVIGMLRKYPHKKLYYSQN